MVLNKAVLAFDTSNYTTSIALMDLAGRLLGHQRRMLIVPEGQRGLRQSDALFQHVRELPGLLEALKSPLEKISLTAVGCSDRPRRVEGSYMPVFLAGESIARSLATVAGVPCHAFSHQEGHLAAGLWSLGLSPETPFYALHLSGGTTELLRVTPLPDGGFSESIVGATADISLGQLIDRTGVALGLPFPAGPSLERLAGECREDPFDIPFSLTTQPLRMSLSGPENFLRQRISDTSPERIASSLFHFSGKLLSLLVRKACEKEALPMLITMGGVAANGVVRESMQHRLKTLPLTIHHTQREWCSDNAAGTASLLVKALTHPQSLQP